MPRAFLALLFTLTMPGCMVDLVATDPPPEGTQGGKCIVTKVPGCVPSSDWLSYSSCVKSVRCDPGLLCLGGVCQPPGELGSDCSQWGSGVAITSSCREGLACGDGKCVPAPGEGQACLANRCAPGHRCSGSICRPDVGTACKAECAAGRICSGGVCRLPIEGEPCTTWECALGLICNKEMPVTTCRRPETLPGGGK
ncbi:MAG: hypothetical protein IPJ34_37255 [Myxococcales bacterium]|nr:hypothetical protein [Myxococcales bacterium]